MKIELADIYILATLYYREKKDLEGLGIFMLQKIVNEASGRQKYSHNYVMSRLSDLQFSDYIQYCKKDFWSLTQKGLEGCQDLEENEGFLFSALMIRISQIHKQTFNTKNRIRK